MDFNFLPKLPKSNLDDRTYKDLVEECILRIPRYCPEWTNHNPGDPGITLIEMFAWLTDQMLLRFNQVPRRNYITFLELMGIRLNPPTPARCELTFYLTKAQPDIVRIPFATEVATLRTETEESVNFTTDHELIIANPQIKHLLTADTPEDIPQQLRDCTPLQWQNFDTTLLFENSIPGNCFYLVIEDPEYSLEGHVISLNVKGEAAQTIGIDPDHPPRVWSAWNGKNWQEILRMEDHTKGFSFSEVAQPLDGANIILHLPQQLPNTVFSNGYKGHWIRCVYTQPLETQPSYSSSPSIIGLSVNAIGAAVNATQCIRIEHELVGVSNGKAGQVFELQSVPILERVPHLGEYILVKSPSGRIQNWVEVSDFGTSTPDDLHYTIDSQTGTIQFGPLIREPGQLKEFTHQRGLKQPGGRIVNRQSARTNNLATYIPPSVENTELDALALERQYGKVPSIGSEIYMLAYRTGGGSKGNVQAGKITVIKNSIPYVQSVINYEHARGGTDAESLDEAVMRVPQMLRTRETAVTPEDFERVAKEAAQRAVARVHCLTKPEQTTAGIVRLLVVPKSIDIDTFDFRNGMSPDEFSLSEELKAEILQYMSDRKPLGIQVKLELPEYVGVSVKTQVILEPQYNNPRDQQRIRASLLELLYRFLNPLIGGFEGKGWELGRPVYPSDVVALCQKVPGVRYLSVVELFSLIKYGEEWLRADMPEPEIDPGPTGLICSWSDTNAELLPSHVIEFKD